MNERHVPWTGSDCLRRGAWGWWWDHVLDLAEDALGLGGHVPVAPHVAQHLHNHGSVIMGGTIMSGSVMNGIVMNGSVMNDTATS